MNIDNQDTMQIAFEQFMLSNSNGDKANSSDEIHLSSIKQEKDKRQKANEASDIRFNQRVKKLQKSYWQNFKSFCDTVQKEWLDTDSQMENVVLSISNIRNRLPLEMGLIKTMSKEVCSSYHGENSKFWCNYGLRRSKQSFHGPSYSWGLGIFLNQSDVQQTISHDLIEHEKMMIALRNLLSNMSASQQKLGKYLEDITKLHIDLAFDISSTWRSNTLDESDEINSSHLSDCSQFYPMHLINDLNEAFVMLSYEFHRKQNLVQLIIGSANDALLHDKDEDKHVDVIGEFQIDLDKLEEVCPRYAASTCSNQWSISSQESTFDKSRLNKILAMAENY